MSITKAFKDQFVKHLEALQKEVNAYENETDLWKTSGSISNPAGTLVLHLTGNLNHFIGAQIGNTGYVRERDKEFSEKNVARKDLMAGLEKTGIMLQKTFDAMDDAELAKIFPLNNFGENKTIHEVLLILLSHFNYHLGQVNYHRRMI